MHQDRKWVRTRFGAWKRSQHRTHQDELGEWSWDRFWKAVRQCEVCAQSQSYLRRWTCATHRDVLEQLERHYDTHSSMYRATGRGTPPRWWRRQRNRKHRFRMRDLVRRGRTEECYDQPREEGWYW